ncbi:MAG: hypothetical protein HY200_08665 [Nitrospirae bacterium]|nr:hypothetical protein [Nitrospirota bacterium]
MAKPFRTISSLIFFLLLSGQSAHAAVSVGVGPEYFIWKEYASDGSNLLTESGLRAAFRFNWLQDKNTGLLFGYEGKFYLGSVFYEGQTLSPPVQPVSTTTRYTGIQNEAIFILRPAHDKSLTLDIETRFGWDHWKRNIDPLGADQIEEYDILFLKLGPSFHIPISSKNEVWFSIGGKLPVFTYENAHINDICYNESLFNSAFSNCVDKNPPLHPGQEISLYAIAGIQISSQVNISAYFDSYRFSRSAFETETSHRFYQPESIMQLIGIRGDIRFP